MGLPWTNNDKNTNISVCVTVNSHVYRTQVIDRGGGGGGYSVCQVMCIGSAGETTFSTPKGMTNDPLFSAWSDVHVRPHF